MSEWREQPMTYRDGFRFMLAWAMVDAIANGPLWTAFIDGFSG